MESNVDLFTSTDLSPSQLNDERDNATDDTTDIVMLKRMLILIMKDRTWTIQKM